MEKIYKAFSVETKAIDADAGIYEVMITTEATDRQGDIVRATGVQMEDFLKNPVVLYAHDYGGLPVAKATSLEVLPGNGIKSSFQFPVWGTSAQADVVRRLWAAGYLNAVSIGFIPLEWKPIDSKEPWGAQDYVSWELLEYSIVPVPANQEALRLAVKTYQEGLQKRGRVLSAVNEKRIRSASDLLDEVLSSLGEEQPDDPDKSVRGNPDKSVRGNPDKSVRGDDDKAANQGLPPNLGDILPDTDAPDTDLTSNDASAGELENLLKLIFS